MNLKNMTGVKIITRRDSKYSLKAKIKIQIVIRIDKNIEGGGFNS